LLIVGRVVATRRHDDVYGRGLLKMLRTVTTPEWDHGVLDLALLDEIVIEFFDMRRDFTCGQHFIDQRRLLVDIEDVVNGHAKQDQEHERIEYHTETVVVGKHPHVLTLNFSSFFFFFN